MEETDGTWDLVDEQLLREEAEESNGYGEDEVEERGDEGSEEEAELEEDEQQEDEEEEEEMDFNFDGGAIHDHDDVGIRMFQRIEQIEYEALAEKKRKALLQRQP